MTLRQRRLMWIAIGIVILGIATALVLQAFRSNLVYFYTPSQVANAEAPKSRAFRIGGLVEAGSLKRGDNLSVEFRVTDTARTVMVAYKGILPDLFREGKGVVALGSMQPDGLFHASEVYAKHDENYMPPEAAEALKRAGKPIEGQIFAGESGVVTQPAVTTPPPPAPKS